METVLKIVLGLVLVLVVFIVGCSVVVGVGINDAVDDLENEFNEAAITQADFRSVKVGPKGNSRKRIEARFGEPQSQKDIESDGAEGIPVPKPGLECVYYNNEDEEDALYRFCFEKATQRVRSKSSF